MEHKLPLYHLTNLSSHSREGKCKMIHVHVSLSLYMLSIYPIAFCFSMTPIHSFTINHFVNILVLGSVDCVDCNKSRVTRLAVNIKIVLTGPATLVYSEKYHYHWRLDYLYCQKFPKHLASLQEWEIN